MKPTQIKSYLFLIFFLSATTSSCSKETNASKQNKNVVKTEKDSHGHDEHTEEKGADSHGHDEHTEEKGADSHGHDEHTEEKKEEGQENSKIGDSKGIMKADEVNGFILSPEALKNFNISFILIKNQTITIPESAILKSLEETNIYRRRNQYIKRIDFQVVSKNDKLITIKSNDLTINDEIAIEGIGFIRISELAAYGGAEEGHSH